MEGFIQPALDNYIHAICGSQSALLDEIEAFTLANHPKAHMQSGKAQGRFLAIMSKLMRPKRILDVGTFHGFSALCLAEGLREDGELHTIENRQHEAEVACGYFNRSDKGHQIHLHFGDAKEILPRMSQTWDIVFLDADKTGLSVYYEALLPRLAPQGILIVDNALFHGQVMEVPVKGKNAVAVDNFNRMVARDGRVEKTLLPLRDGLLLIKKLNS